MKHLLKLADLSTEEIFGILNLASITSSKGKSSA